MAEGAEVWSNLSSWGWGDANPQSTRTQVQFLDSTFEKLGVEDAYNPTIGDTDRQTPGSRWLASHQGKFKANEKLWCKHKEGGGQKGRGEGGG